MDGVYTRTKDNKTNIFQIQGARAHDSNDPIAGINFLNYDNDSSNMFKMASILMFDSYGDITRDGFGDLAFHTRIGSCNSAPLSEVMRLKHDGCLCIGTSNASGVLNVGGDVVVGQNIQISGDIMPTQTHQQNIGSSNLRFKTAWVDSLYLSSNTLYLGTTPVLGTSGDVITIKADSNQGINLHTAGVGETSLMSEAGVNITASGMNAQVVMQSTGPGGKISFGARDRIAFTAPDCAFTGDMTVCGKAKTSNLIVEGDLTVSGNTFIVNVQSVEVEDNIIRVNNGEQGYGVTAGQAGLRVNRGQLVDFLLVFDESSQALLSGPMGQLQTIATQPWAVSNLVTRSSNVIFSAVTATDGIFRRIAGSNAAIDIGSDADTTDISIGCGSHAQNINLGLGSGVTTINIGGPGDSVNIGGSMTNVHANKITVTEPLITLNESGSVNSATNCGIQFEEGGSISGYIKTGSDRNKFLFKSPGGGEASMDLSGGNIAFNNGTLVINSNAGAVGIGTFSPGVELDVLGTVNASTAYLQGGSNLSTVYGGLPAVTFGSNTSAAASNVAFAALPRTGGTVTGAVQLQAATVSNDLIVHGGIFETGVPLSNLYASVGTAAAALGVAVETSNVMFSGTSRTTGWQLDSNVTATTRHVVIGATEATGYELAVNGQVGLQRLVVERSLAALAEGGLDNGLILASNVQASNVNVSGALYASTYCNLPDYGWKTTGTNTLQNSNDVEVDGQVSALRLVVGRSTSGDPGMTSAMFGRFSGVAAAGQGAEWSADVDRIPMATSSGSNLVVKAGGWYSVACSDVSQSGFSVGGLSLNVNDGPVKELAVISGSGIAYHATRFMELVEQDRLGVVNATASTTSFKLCLKYMGPN